MAGNSKSQAVAANSQLVMVSCNLWLVLMALLPVIKISFIYCQCTDDYRLTPFLVAIKSNDSGLEIRTLFQEGLASVGSSGTSQSWPTHVVELLEPQTKFIPGYSLSSKCGDEYYQCQELLVVNDSSHNNDLGSLSIVFVPLETGVLLLRFWYDSNATIVQWNTSIVNSSNCTPTVFYKINGKFYIVCISSYYYEEHLIYNATVYEVRLKFSGSGTGTTLTEQTKINVMINNISLSNISNFIIVEQRIYFAIGSTIVVLDILDSTRTQQYPELPQSLCHQVYKLVESVDARNQTLLVVYCTDGYILYDPVFGDWFTRSLFSSSGVPYLCPDNIYRATLFTESGTLRFSVRDSILITINNTNINNGICFESQNVTYFAYSDQRHYNIYVYDFIGQIDYPISPYFCLHSHKECPQLFTLLDNQYLVIRDSDRDRILDTKTNFSLIFNISSGIADILAILHIISNTSAITPSPPSTTTESAPSSRADEVLTSDSTVVSTDIQTDIPSTIPITEQLKSTDLQLALIVVSSIAVVVIIINIIAITVYFFKRYRKHHR